MKIPPVCNYVSLPCPFAAPVATALSQSFSFRGLPRIPVRVIVGFIKEKDAARLALAPFSFPSPPESYVPVLFLLDDKRAIARVIAIGAVRVERKAHCRIFSRDAFWI